MSLLHAVGTWHRGEAGRLIRNVQFIKKAKCDYARILGQVGWTGQEIDPFWPDYQQTLANVIDAAWNEGLRTQLTAIGGWASAKPPKPGQGPIECAQRMIEVVQSRKEKVIFLEAVNEDNASEEQAVAIAKLFKPLGLPFGVGLGNKGITTITRATKAAGANVSSYHTSRVLGPANDPGGKYARMVRQCWDFKEFETASKENEPPGIASSVNTLPDPFIMAVKRCADIICGGADFVIHPGAGVFGKFMTGSWGTRHANLDEVPGLLEMALLTKNAETHLPAGIEHWTKFNTGKPVEVIAGRCNKLYGARSGKDFREIVIGAEGTLTLRAQRGVRFTVANPATGEMLSGANPAQVSGLWGYLIIGTTP